MPKILCPVHSDTRPSMEVYQNNGKNWGHCFSCGAHIDLDEYNIEEEWATKRMVDKPKTNISEMLRYIESLPIAPIRGVDLHYNERGYFVLWPDRTYYKHRLNEGRTRYIGPSGCKPPLFLYPGPKTKLIVVEGELNCMSLFYSLLEDIAICSPGSATELSRHIQSYLQYDEVIVVVDHDAPGVVFGSQLITDLHIKGKRATLITLEEDFNQVLQDGGEEAVRKTFEGVIK